MQSPKNQANFDRLCPKSIVKGVDELEIGTKFADIYIFVFRSYTLDLYLNLKGI